MLSSVRVVESATLSGDAVGMYLADLGAEVIKVEDPRRGDPVRSTMLVEGDNTSPLHRKWNRGKRSVAIDVRQPAGRELFEQLVARSEVLIEGSRPGTLKHRGIDPEALRAKQPSLVFASLSGFGQHGPYAELAAHGDSFEAYAGLRPPYLDANGLPAMPGSINAGIQMGPLLGALAVVAAVVEARTTGRGRTLDASQADAAVYWNALAVDDEATDRWRATKGLPPRGAYFGMTDRDPHNAGAGAVRCQYYATSDGRHVLFNALERHFFERFAEAIDRPDLLEMLSDKPFDHQFGDLRLRTALTAVFEKRTLDEWMEIGTTADVPMVPVNTRTSIIDDPHFRERVRWLDADLHGGSMMAFPVLAQPPLDLPEPAPSLGRDTDEVLTAVLALPPSELRALRDNGVIGPVAS